MKKTYNAPSIMVVNVENDSILAASTFGVAEYTGQETLLGRRRGVFYDEDYDDFDEE